MLFDHKFSFYFRIFKLALSVFLVFGGCYALLDVSDIPLPALSYSLIHLVLLALLWSPSLFAQVVASYCSIFIFFQCVYAFVMFSMDDENYITLRPNIQSEFTVEGLFPGIFGRQKITTDARGFRTSSEINYEKPNGKRIFAIGGSTTSQDLLGDEETWTSLLEGSLRESTSSKVEVVNTGVSGLRAIHHLETLKRISSSFPNLVVFLLGANDWNHHIYSEFNVDQDVGLKDRSSYLRIFDAMFSIEHNMFARAFRSFVNSGFSPALSSEITHATIEQYYTGYESRRNSLARFPTKSFFPKAVDENYERVVGEIMEYCKEKSIRCLFMTQPTAYRADVPLDLKERFWMTPPKARDYTLDLRSMIHLSELYNAFLVSSVKAHAFEVCDVAKDFPFEGFYDDMHFNEFGARELSKRLLECLFKDEVMKMALDSLVE